MYCPHCGAENDGANRFCVACGADLPKRPGAAPKAPVSLRKRLGLIFGTTTRARLISTGTAVAALVAIVAFFALKPSRESAPEGTYLRGIDQSCVGEKERISNLETETLQQRPPNFEEFASVLVTIVAEWRSNLQGTPPPPAYKAGTQALSAALLAVLIEAGTLARVAREDSDAGVIDAQAHSVDEATAAVDRAIEGLGLERCSEIKVSPQGRNRP
jgi:hypothetical protein